MNLKKKNILLIVVFCILVIITLILVYFHNKEEDYVYEKGEDISIKHYKENEYIPVNISYDQIARIYLQDYVYKLLYDREAAYNSLDKEYRKNKFSSFEEFNSYIDDFVYSKKLKEMKVDKYAVTERNDFRDIDVYDAGENLFIFRETGVMQYTVFFDRFTVNM